MRVSGTVSAHIQRASSPKKARGASSNGSKDPLQSSKAPFAVITPASADQLEKRFVGQESSSSSSTGSSTVGTSVVSHSAVPSPSMVNVSRHHPAHRRMPSQEELDESIVQAERCLSMNEPSKALAIVEKLLSGPPIDSSICLETPITRSTTSSFYSSSSASSSSSSSSMAGIGPEEEAQPTQDPAFPASATDPKSTTIDKDTMLLSHTLDSARAIRCKSLVHLGEWSQALGACQHAISHTPDNHELLYLSGKCLVELRRPNEAVALFGLAIEAKSDHLPSWLARGLTFHIHLKDPARAVSDFHTSIVLNPTYYKAFFYMGMAMTDLQRHELAVEAYCRSIHLNATYSESYFRRGVIHLQHQRLELAIEDFAKVSELVPYSAEAHYNRALAQHLLKRNEDAIASYNCCLQYQPTYVNALKNCALAQSELGLYNEAFENYSTALEDCKLDDTTKMDILMSRGQVCERNHDLDQALADYTQAIELNPSFGRAHTCRGLLQIQRHDLSSALTDLSTALLLEPENARAWNNRGTVYLQLNQLDLALSDFEHSISLCPGFVKALRNRGKVYYLQQNLPSALQSLTAAIQQPTSSADPECFILRGSVNHSLGLTFRAFKDFGRAPEAARKRNWRVEQSDLLGWMSSEH